MPGDRIARRFGGTPFKHRSRKRQWEPPWPQRNPPFPFQDLVGRRQRILPPPRRGRVGYHWFDTFPQTPCQNNVLVDQPIGYWPLAFNGVSSITETDYSGTHSDLTWTLAPTALTLEDKSGVSLAGDRETSAAAATWQGPLSWTVEWWMQSTATSIPAAFMAIISRRAGANDDWAVYVDRTNGRLQINWTNQGGVVSQTATSTGVNVLDGSMHHCVAETTYDPVSNNTNYQFYVDTIDRGHGQIFAGGSAKTTLEPFRPMGENGTRQYIGNIAGLAFYNYGLSQSRVISHFQCIQGTWNPTTIIVRYPRRWPAWRRSRRAEPPLPQAAAPVAPVYPYEILRAARRRAYRVPRPRFWVLVPPQAAPPGVGPVKEPIYGVLVTDGHTTGILVSDGRTTGVLLTDGHTLTYLIS